MLAELVLATVCSGPACAEKAVTKDVHRTKSVVVKRDVEPVQRVVECVRARSWRLFIRR